MTQQFKFGDMVRHPDFDSPCVFIDQLYDTETKEKTWAIVLNENEYDRGTQFVTHELLTLIQHPDNVRLDWLLRDSTPRYISNVRNDEWELLNDVTGLWQEYGSADSAELIGQGATIREAIDNAMERQAAE